MKRTVVGLGGVVPSVGPAMRAAAPTPPTADLPAQRAGAGTPGAHADLPAAVAPGLPRPRATPPRPQASARVTVEDLPSPARLPAAKGEPQAQGAELPSPRAPELPTPKGDSPATKARSPKSTVLGMAPPPGFDDLDLPAVGLAANGLPARAPSSLPGARAPSDFDFPATRTDTDLPSLRSDFGEIDLPDLTPQPKSAPLGHPDLPGVAAAGAHLPAVRPIDAHLPMAVSRDAHLPMQMPRDAHLPTSAEAHLPAIGGDRTNLPSPRGIDPFADHGAPQTPDIAGRRESDLGVAQTMIGPGYQPTPLADMNDGFGDLDLPAPTPELGAAPRSLDTRNILSGPPASALKGADFGGSPDPQQSPAAATGMMSDFGELELPGPHAGGSDPFGTSPSAQTLAGPGAPPVISDAQPRQRAPSLMIDDVQMPTVQEPSVLAPSMGSPIDASMGPASRAGGMGFGEVDLGGSSGDDDMEFGAIPQEQGRMSAEMGRISGALPPKSKAPEAAEALPKAPSRAGRYVLAFAAAVVLAGAGLEFTKYGAFARHEISDRLNAQKHAALETSVMRRTRGAFAEDALDRANAALVELEKDAASAPRYAPLVAYAAYANFAYEVRFGNDAQRDARARALLARVVPDSTSKRLAAATRDLVAGQLPAARGVLKAIAKDDPKNVDASVLLGELELRARAPKDAVAAFQLAVNAEDSARTRFGLLRALDATGDGEGAARQAEKIAAKYPNHAPSRLFLAHLAWEKGRDEKGATKWLDELKSPAAIAAASISDQIDAGTLRGMILLERGRVTEAKSAFDAASAAARGAPAAGPQLGIGEVNMANGQYAAAIANFKGASEADPTLTPAKIGIARAQLKLEKPGEAKLTLTPLKDPKYAGQIGYWLGQAEEKLNPEKPTEAMKIYGDAIKQQPTEAKPYIALANLQAKIGKSEDADATLAAAARAVPPSDRLFVGIGGLRFRQGRYHEALENFDKALAVQPENLEALFDKGRTLLRMEASRVEDGKAVLDAVEKKDARYPGLALEMGFYYQTTHQIEEALKRYQSALDAAPNDVDVKLQVGRAMVESRDPKAEETLHAVLDKCSTGSAAPDICTLEAKHYLGRALLNKGAAGDAVVFLKQAAEKGDKNAVYQLYYGWALEELSRLDEARRALADAIELDKSMGDAYWLLAEIAAKQQLYREAIERAQEALKLNPSRHDAHATIAASQKGLNNEGSALAEWAIAIRADPNNPKAPFWRFQVADLRYHGGSIASATDDLQEAIKAAAAMDNKPPWLPKAHFYLGEALRLRDRDAAKKEYKLYLDTSIGITDPARKDAKAALLELGAPYTGP